MDRIYQNWTRDEYNKLRIANFILNTWGHPQNHAASKMMPNDRPVDIRKQVDVTPYVVFVFLGLNYVEDQSFSTLDEAIAHAEQYVD